MPRTARASRADICYHAMSRRNGGEAVFLDASDYAAFDRLMRHVVGRVPMRILAWCLMPNHFHFVLWPYCDGDLSRWMHLLLTGHVKRRCHKYKTGLLGSVNRLGRPRSAPT